MSGPDAATWSKLLEPVRGFLRLASGCDVNIDQMPENLFDHMVNVHFKGRVFRSHKNAR